MRTRLPLSAIRRLIPPTTLAFGLAFRLATPRKDLLMSICQNPPYFRDCQRENLPFTNLMDVCVEVKRGERWIMFHIMDRTFLGIVYSYMLFYLSRSMYNRVWQSRVSIFLWNILIRIFLFYSKKWSLCYEFFFPFSFGNSIAWKD